MLNKWQTIFSKSALEKMLPKNNTPPLTLLMSVVKAQTDCLINSKTTAALSIRILGSIGSRLKVVYIQSQCLSY